MSVRATVIEEFKRVAAEHDKSITSLDDTTALLDAGLDSLCFAIVVVRLEDALGVEPFSATEVFPVTVGDFIALYERAVPVEVSSASKE